MSRAQPAVVVIGGGIAGLVAAHELARYGVVADVYEAGPRVAGMATSRTDPDGFSYDVGAHFVTNRFVAALGMPGPFRTLPRYGEVVHLRPQCNPRYPLGLLGVPRYVRSAAVERVRRPLRDLAVAADRFRHDFGPALAEEVAIPLLEAWSGLAADQLSASVIDKIPTGLLQTIWLRAAQHLSRRAVTIGYCKEQPSATGVFHVSPQGGIAAICEHVAAGLPRPVRLDHPAEAVYVDSGHVVGARVNGTDIETDTVISTLPINRLPQIVHGTELLDRFGGFRFRALVLVNLKIVGRGVLPDVVVWTPHGFPYFRVSETPLCMPWAAPDGKTMVLCEIGAQPGDEVWSLTDEQAVERCVTTLDPLIPGIRARVVGATVLRQPLGYPVFDLAYEQQRVDLANEGTGIDGLYSIGRNGEYDHILMEDIFWRLRRRIPLIIEHRQAPRSTRTIARSHAPG